MLPFVFYIFVDDRGKDKVGESVVPAGYHHQRDTEPGANQRQGPADKIQIKYNC